MDRDNFCKGYDFEEMFCFQGGIEPYFWLFVNSKLISVNILLEWGKGGDPGFGFVFITIFPLDPRM